MLRATDLFMANRQLLRDTGVELTDEVDLELFTTLTPRLADKAIVELARVFERMECVGCGRARAAFMYAFPVCGAPHCWRGREPCGLPARARPQPRQRRGGGGSRL